MAETGQAANEQDPPSTEEHRDRDAALEAAQEDETVSDQKNCPECGEPVHNLRATCPNCGHEYGDREYDDPDAGKEFVSGTGLDEEGRA